MATQLLTTFLMINGILLADLDVEPRQEKTCSLSVRPDPAQTRLYG